MPEQVKVVTTSKKWKLNLNDWEKGLLMAVGAPVIAQIIKVTTTGSLAFDWKELLTIAISAAGIYLLKNLGTPSQTVITGPQQPAPGVKIVPADTSVSKIMETQK